LPLLNRVAITMSYTIIDRRVNGKGKSIPNRQKFLKRVTKNVKEMMKKSVQNGKISDIAIGAGGKVKVPITDINEPHIRHGAGGLRRKVLPYNKRFVEGDQIPRPPSGGRGKGNGNGSGNGQGEDSFTFTLTKDEFLDYFFEDMELPNLHRKQINIVDDYKIKRAGYSTDGTPSRLDILRSMREAVGRRFALSKNPNKEEIEQLTEELEVLKETIFPRMLKNEDVTKEQSRIAEIEELLAKLKKEGRVAFVDDMDLRYRQWTLEPVPATQAAVFCIMDVSGSMTEWHKDLAKRFFMLLYLFLYYNYKKVDLVFIRHHNTAKEVNEQEFFYAKDTGGTTVSSGLELMLEIAKKRYNNLQWNIYVAHCSDGDAEYGDIVLTQDLFREILSMVQYYFYVEISKRDNSELHNALTSVAGENFASVSVSDPNEIYPVFKGLFEKRK